MIYLDTSGLIALSDKKDENHLSAKNYFLSVLGKEVFVIGKNVLVEYLDGVAKRVSKEKAIFELDNILNSKIMRIEFETKDDFDKAIKYFKKYKDKIDFTDCLSFAIAERLRIKEVFTFDKDFEIHGLKVVRI